MSANPNLTPNRTETSGEQIFFVMAIAFGVLVLTIVLGAFLPLAAGIGLIFGVLGVVLAVVGAFIARVLSDS